ncbi:MAG TPA: hypothetical protein VFU73_08765 [Actinocrinis sp.]|nr:hypothetical protein [Actinocrinis sp.]
MLGAARAAAVRITTARRLMLLMPCLAVIGWVWWDSQADGYTGLPVNTLGQIIGDLILAALAGPVALGYRFARHERTRPAGDVVARIARARNRVQLLDVTGCLLSWSEAPARTADRQDADRGRDRLVAALRAALERDVAVEVLLPAPSLAQSRGVPRTLGLSPAALRDLAEGAEADLHALFDEVPAGRLEVRYSQKWPALAMLRCDDHMWVSLRPEGLPGSPPLCLEFAARTANARAVAAHFNDLLRSNRSYD